MKNCYADGVEAGERAKGRRQSGRRSLWGVIYGALIIWACPVLRELFAWHGAGTNRGTHGGDLNVRRPKFHPSKLRG